MKNQTRHWTLNLPFRTSVSFSVAIANVGTGQRTTLTARVATHRSPDASSQVPTDSTKPVTAQRSVEEGCQEMLDIPGKP